MASNANLLERRRSDAASPQRSANAGPRPFRPTPVQPESTTLSRAGIRVLVVDDERSTRESCAGILRLEGYELTECGRGSEALELLRRGRFHIVLVDLYMSTVDGMTLLKAAKEASPDTLVIVMTGNPSVESSVEALRAGAWEYLPKPFSATQLQVVVGRAAHTVVIASETRSRPASREAPDEPADALERCVSPAFREVTALARKVAATDASVFITGESGAGKEMIARFIHARSQRASRPFVAINCAALPEALLESEMFGHRKGAFTDAVRDKVGLMETADGGTLFLDELVEMSPSIQAKLLRVLQDGVLRRVGSDGPDTVVNVRFIAATNRDPAEAVRNGMLREDLFYRLRVFPIHVPPLRERPEDVVVLAEHFLQTLWTRHRGRDGAIPVLSAEAHWALRQAPWNGNVRELQNVIEHAVVLLEPGARVGPADLSLASVVRSTAPEPEEAPEPAGPDPDDLVDERYHVARERVITQFELQYLTHLIERAQGNMSRAARLAGVDRTTLYRLMERHDLHRTPRDQWIVSRTAESDHAPAVSDAGRS